MALAADKSRRYSRHAMENHQMRLYPVAATTIIYEGAALGVTGGNARPIAADDLFAGFAFIRADNGTGAAGAKRVDVLSRGFVELAVFGVTATTAIGAPILASDDDTFTVTEAADRMQVGKFSSFIGADGFGGHVATSCLVYFEAEPHLVGTDATT